MVTGTEGLDKDSNRKKFPAVYRRFNAIARISWLEEADIRAFFRAFLSEFVPTMTVPEWRQWEDMFLDGSAPAPCVSPWKSRHISLDMLKQFLRQQVTTAAVNGLGTELTCKNKPGAEAGTFQVNRSALVDFRDLICNMEKAESFLRSFAPICQT